MDTILDNWKIGLTIFPMVAVRRRRKGLQESNTSMKWAMKMLCVTAIACLMSVAEAASVVSFAATVVHDPLDAERQRLLAEKSAYPFRRSIGAPSRSPRPARNRRGGGKSLELPCVAGSMRSPSAGAVAHKGHVAEKLDSFVSERMKSQFARHEIFAEARRAFELRDDDIKGHGGYWRGEFWGKLMLGTARMAAYLDDAELKRFVLNECHRLMELQDKDGYLGSYADKELVSIVDPAATKRVYGWCPVWNIWNRKYCIWGMYAAYQTTGDKTILESAIRQMDQLIDMLKRKGLRLSETGTLGMCGLPSMSLLKPLMLLYRETGNAAYLDFARETVSDWDREDGKCPNFIRNFERKDILSSWYPSPSQWAKAYEMMSCLDGLLEYGRTCGDVRAIQAVVSIRDNIMTSEANPFGGVGFGDKFINARRRVNGLSEVCDAIHWIRLNYDLFMTEGDDRYLDAMEVAFFNNFLPGVYRKGDYGAFFIRAAGRHETQHQCGFAYNHCCVNNVPRTWVDMAEAAITVDESGCYHVNFYTDIEAVVDGVAFSVTGNYPIGDEVVVKVKSDKNVPIHFRRPGWCSDFDVVEEQGGYRLRFRMRPRIVERVRQEDILHDEADKWMANRYVDGNRQSGQDVAALYREAPACTLWRGPLLLAKAKRAGATEAEILGSTTGDIDSSWNVHAVPLRRDGVWGAWTLEFTSPTGVKKRVDVCDFESAGDAPYGRGANAFSIWF